MEISPGEVRSNEVRLAEVRAEEVGLEEVRPAELRQDIGVLVTPRVPGLHALLEDRDVFVVRHWSIPSADTILSGMQGLCNGLEAQGLTYRSGRSPDLALNNFEPGDWITHPRTLLRARRAALG